MKNSIIENSELFCFDDLIIKPSSYSRIESRSQVSTSVKVNYKGKDIEFDTPIISSPMSNVTGMNMCIAMNDCNSLAIVHRFMTRNNQIDIVKKIKILSSEHFIGAAVGVQKEDKQHVTDLINAGVDLICIDVAFANAKKSVDFIIDIYSEIKKSQTLLMIGSISGISHIDFFEENKIFADFYRVGIGGGSICTTTIQTGHGIPLAYSIYDIDFWHSKDTRKYKIVADGGIRNSGDIAKAIALGADFVMCGSLLAGCDESEGEFEDVDGVIHKKYFGMASKENQKDKKNIYEEGVCHRVKPTGPVKTVIRDLMNGLKSACSYSDAFNLNELYKNAEIGNISSAALGERKAHIFNKG